MATAYGRQLLRDERAPRVERIKALMAEVAGCFAAKRYEAGLVMQFIELDTWAYLTRPKGTKHGRSSFKRFIGKYLHSDPDQPYQYAAEDVYAARCGLLHTFGSISDLHHNDNTLVIWRFHLGRCNTYIPGLDGYMAYISVFRFWRNASEAVARCLDDVMADPALNELFGSRLPQVYFQAGVLPSRDPDALVVIEPAIDAELLKLGNGTP